MRPRYVGTNADQGIVIRRVESCVGVVVVEKVYSYEIVD